ncbi:MAG: hypothetical protein VXX91_07780 [Planctomycetota bacterium]|nr:hypothetical protein [Planctomycetota bacterium]
MNIIKTTIATAAALSCCIGIKLPANAYTTMCMDMGLGMTQCNGPDGSHTIMDLDPSPNGLDTVDIFGNPGTHIPEMKMCNTIGSMTTCF